MNYSDTIEYLFTQMPMFQKIGAGAYKPGLDTACALASAFNNPQDWLKCIHVGGTNGKGSTSHTIASVLQKAGYKVALFTSPHLVDFRERIRINGEMIPERDVCDFVEKFKSKHLDVEWSPSFFELTTIMAFDWFAKENVDFAVIEVGLGGRLDTTNIISPIISIITNISFDHTALLGNTLAEIASEKAGIIKPHTPVVIGEADDDLVRKVFEKKACSEDAPITFACDSPVEHTCNKLGQFVYDTKDFGTVIGELTGDCQWLNANTVFHALKILREQGVIFTDKNVADGFADVTNSTGLMGRWMKISDKPLTVCDTGHNIGGWQYLAPRLDKEASHRGHLHMVIGFVSDKDVTHILEMMPRGEKVSYYFVKASVDRALSSTMLREMASQTRLYGEAFQSVADGYEAALKKATADDMVFVGGSTFVVADVLAIAMLS